LFLTAAAAATAELSDEEKAEVGPLKEAIARALFWTQKIINPPLKNAVCALVDYVFPVPAAVSTLLFAVGCLVGIAPSDMKDPCKDIAWDPIKAVSRCAPFDLISTRSHLAFYTICWCVVIDCRRLFSLSPVMPSHTMPRSPAQ
jgi:hypothetical protein